MFNDRAIVTFVAGNGGDGCMSFRREKYLPRGGPDGGDGGKGGDIILLSSSKIHSLIDFKGKKIIKADRGRNGMGSNKTGKSGDDILIPVPAGTVIKTYPEEKIIFDFDKTDKKFVIAQGGKGGAGNSRFKSSVNRAPRLAKGGTKGESIKVVLELKLIAFAGLVGLPNAGKSTLISKLSRAKPKIAEYPFTTLTPNLGVVYSGYDSLVIADIPGIIEGAHKGEGMGHKFLRHIERNRVLLFVIDISPYAPYPPLETFKLLLKELKYYKNEILKKKFLIAANKTDLFENMEFEDHLSPLRKYCMEKDLGIFCISAVKGIGIDKLKENLFKLLNEN